MGGPSVFSPGAAGVAEMNRRLDEKLLRGRQVAPERGRHAAERRKRGHERRVREREERRELERKKEAFADKQAAAKAKREEGQKAAQQKQEKDSQQTTIQWKVQKLPLIIWKPGGGDPNRFHPDKKGSVQMESGVGIEVGDILLGPVNKWVGKEMGSIRDFESQKRVTWLEYKKIKKPNVKKPLNEHGWVQVGRKFMGAANIVPIKGEPAPEYRVPPS